MERDWKSELLARIERYCRLKGISEGTFGSYAMNDGKFVARLRAGGGIGVERLTRVHRYLDENWPKEDAA